MFWKANAQNMVKLTTAPDMYWKQGDNYRPETLTHFFQPDSYYKDPNKFNQIPHSFQLLVQKFGSDVAINNGSAPWRANQFYALGVQALKNKDFKTALVMAGLMSHYIGDMSQPLHMTENFDGQMTNDKGIHKFFETTNVIPNVPLLYKGVPFIAQQFLGDPNFRNQFKGSVVDATFNELYRAYAKKDQLIKTDLTFGRVGKGALMQLSLARDRMADGAASLAMILSHMWQEGGQQDNGATGAIQIPNWIEPNYYSAVSALQGRPAPVTMSCFQRSDDCY